MEPTIERRMPVLGVVLATLAVMVVTIYALAVFLLGECGRLGGTGGTFAAVDSPQGRVCGWSEHANLMERFAWLLIPVAAAGGFLLALTSWSYGHLARCLAVVGLVALPLLAVEVLEMAPDECSDADAHAPGRDCRTTDP